MAGDVDYLLKVIVPDMAAYDAFYLDLTHRPAVPQRDLEVLDGADEGDDASADRHHATRDPGEQSSPERVQNERHLHDNVVEF
jgi:hypothetical protein